MNHAATAYRRQVRHAMQCSKANQKKGLHDLDVLLSSFVEENPDSEIDEIVQKFGTPHEMAASLCEGVSTDERKRWKKKRWIIFFLCIFLLLCIVAILATHFALQANPAPIQVIDRLVIEST